MWEGETVVSRFNSSQKSVEVVRNLFQLMERYDQVRDMTAFVIHYCIGSHIKITIQGLYCHLLPYCDNNIDSPFLFYNFFYNPPLRTY